MPDLRKAAEQALNVMTAPSGTVGINEWVAACRALSAALAEFDADHQPAGTPQTATKQEPVAWRFRPGPARPWAITDDGYYASCMRDKGYPVEPLYAEGGGNLPPHSEPVAWIDDSGHPKHRLYLQSATEKRLYGSLRPLYPHPAPQRQPLTAQKIRRIVDETVKLATPHEHIVFREVARAIERAHGIE